MANLITFNSLKGGVGKTTILYALANELTKRNNRVLIVDLDSQCNTSSLFGKEYNPDKNVYNLFKKLNMEENIISVRSNLDLIPGSIKTSILSNEVINQVSRERILFKALRKSKIIEKYDYVLFDTHPDFSIVTQNALIISDMIISPINPNQFSFQSIELLSSEWKKFAEDVEITDSLILLPNNIRHNTKSSKKFLKEIKELGRLEDYTFFQTHIPSAEVYNKITLNRDILDNYPRAEKAILAIDKLTDEIEIYLNEEYISK